VYQENGWLENITFLHKILLTGVKCYESFQNVGSSFGEQACG
jgi:hypothetical protein